MKKRRWIGLATLAVTLVVALGFAPRPALAVDGAVAKIGDDEFATLNDAFAAAPKDGSETTIQLIDDATINSSVILAGGTNITLDLAGNAVTANKAIQARGALIIKDTSGEAGTISGPVLGLLQVSGKNAVVTLESGTIETSKANTVSVTVGGAQFSMTGGELKAPEGSAALGLQNGTTSIVGGVVNGDVALDNAAPSSPSLTVGLTGVYDTPIINGNVVSNLKSATVNLVGGTIGGVTGKLPEGGALTSLFSSDISSALPNNGMQCVQQDGQWVVVKLSEENAAAKIVRAGGDVDYYANASIAFSELADGDTVTLYRDAEAQLTVPEGVSATVDLNGHTLTSDEAPVVHLTGSNSGLTIRNGGIASASTSVDASIVGVYGNGGAAISNVALTLEDVDLSMEHSGNAGVIVQGLNTNNTVTLDGCTLTVPNDVMGIYFPPAESTLNVTDTQITAGTGIGVKGGTLNISGNTSIHATGANDPAGIPSTGGIAETGAAIYVDGGYVNRDVTVNVTGGTFASDQGSSVQELVDPKRPAENPVTIKVTAGSFSDDSMGSYLAGGVSVAARADGNFGVYASEEDALANGGAYKVVDENGHAWFFPTETAAKDFATGQAGDATVETVRHTVTFDSRVPNEKDVVVEVVHGQAVTAPADPELAGWTFVGWYTDATFTTRYDFSQPVTDDLALVAQWVEDKNPGGTTDEPDEPAEPTTPEPTAPETEAEKDGGLAETGDAMLLAPLASSLAAGAAALGAGLVLRRRNR